LSRDGSEYSILHQFATNNNRIGLWHSRYSGLAEGRDGAFYGTTYIGGSSNVGTVYKINKDESGYDVLHNSTRRNFIA